MADEMLNDVQVQSIYAGLEDANERLRSGKQVVDIAAWVSIQALLTEREYLLSARTQEPRAIIRHFAAAMERKLAANDAIKGGWRDTGTFKLRSLAVGELTEFLNALHELVNLEDQDAPESVLADARQALLLEAGDTANYLMMICDVMGALPPTDERGR